MRILALASALTASFALAATTTNADPVPGPVLPPSPGDPGVVPTEPTTTSPDPSDTVPVDDTEPPARTPTRTKGGGELGSRVHHHMFGTNPLPVSVGASHAVPNGDSGGAAVSGDNRKTRLAAFHSAASNLVGGDTNGKLDVFVVQR